MTKIALSVALMSVCAWIAIPFSPPFTLQTFALFFTLLLLGGRDGSLAVLAYLLLGFIGAPVFSSFTGGVGAFFGVGGGYLVGFLVAALLFWCLQPLFGKSLFGRLLTMAVGLLACYGVGTAWLALVHLRAAGSVSLFGALAVGVLPYLLPDAVKILLALWLSEKLKKK